MTQTMTLHWSPRSPYVRKVMIAAAEMGLQDRIRTVLGYTLQLASMVEAAPLG